MGTQSHMEMIYARMAEVPIWSAKGPKVTLRRWFSWVHSLQTLMGCWHALLLALCFAGLHTGSFGQDGLPMLKSVPALAPDAAAGAAQSGEQVVSVMLALAFPLVGRSPHMHR